MERMLIVDEGYDLHNSLLLTFGYGEYKITQAMNENQAIKVAETEHPEIIIVNLTGDNESELATCNKLKSIPQLNHSHIILLTSQYQQDETSKHIESVANYCLPKPFCPNNLTTVLTGIRSKKLLS